MLGGFCLEATRWVQMLLGTTEGAAELIALQMPPHIQLHLRTATSTLGRPTCKE